MLKAGELETTVKLTIKDVEKLNNLSGYVMAIKLTMEGSHEHLAIARTRSAYFVKLNLSIRLNNIDSSNKKIEGKGFNKEISFKSDIRPDKLGSLNDGNFTANNWYILQREQLSDDNSTGKTIAQRVQAGHQHLYKRLVYAQIL